MKKIVLLFLCVVSLFAQDVDSVAISSTLQSLPSSNNSSYIKNLYQNSNNMPLWIGDANVKKRNELLEALTNPLFNYKEKDLGRKAVQELQFMVDNYPQSQKGELLAKLDVALSSSFIQLVQFICCGDIDWSLVKEKIASLKEQDGTNAAFEMNPKSFPNQNNLATAVKSGNIESYLTSLIPMQERYKSLVAIFKKYRALKPFDIIPYSYDNLQIGDSSSRVYMVKKRLQELGDYPKNMPLDNFFDSNLKDAVINFQKRFNVDPTGVFDRTTNYYANMPLSWYLKSIATNLDKTKLYPTNLNDNRIEVNIPHFELTYYTNDRPTLRSKVVVGRTDRPTPIINDAIEYIVLNPTWTITDNLIKKDLIGVLKEEPNYLEEHNIKVYAGNDEVQLAPGDLDQYENSDTKVPYRIVQEAGDKNVLGKVKFAFPNPYDVYLHDTDNKDLFDRRYRVYSSGCIRMQKPIELASLLLNSDTGGKYDDSKMNEILDSNKTANVRLDKSLPINILYFTVNKEDNMVYFDYDIYMYDQIIQESTTEDPKETFTIPQNRMVKIEKKPSDSTPTP